MRPRSRTSRAQNPYYDGESTDSDSSTRAPAAAEEIWNKDYSPPSRSPRQATSSSSPSISCAADEDHEQHLLSPEGQLIQKHARLLSQFTEAADRLSLARLANDNTIVEDELLILRMESTKTPAPMPPADLQQSSTEIADRQPLTPSEVASAGTPPASATATKRDRSSPEDNKARLKRQRSHVSSTPSTAGPVPSRSTRPGQRPYNLFNYNVTLGSTLQSREVIDLTKSPSPPDMDLDTARSGLGRAEVSPTGRLSTRRSSEISEDAAEQTTPTPSGHQHNRHNRQARESPKHNDAKRISKSPERCLTPGTRHEALARQLFSTPPGSLGPLGSKPEARSTAAMDVRTAEIQGEKETEKDVVESAENVPVQETAQALETPPMPADEAAHEDAPASGAYVTAAVEPEAELPQSKPVAVPATTTAATETNSATTKPSTVLPAPTVAVNSTQARSVRHDSIQQTTMSVPTQVLATGQQPTSNYPLVHQVPTRQIMQPPNLVPQPMQQPVSHPTQHRQRASNPDVISLQHQQRASHPNVVPVQHEQPASHPSMLPMQHRAQYVNTPHQNVQQAFHQAGMPRGSDQAFPSSGWMPVNTVLHHHGTQASQNVPRSRGGQQVWYAHPAPLPVTVPRQQINPQARVPQPAAGQQQTSLPAGLIHTAQHLVAPPEHKHNLRLQYHNKPEQYEAALNYHRQQRDYYVSGARHHASCLAALRQVDPSGLNQAPAQAAVIPTMNGPLSHQDHHQHSVVPQVAASNPSSSTERGVKGQQVAHNAVRSDSLPHAGLSNNTTSQQTINMLAEQQVRAVSQPLAMNPIPAKQLHWPRNMAQSINPVIYSTNLPTTSTAGTAQLRPNSSSAMPSSLLPAAQNDQPIPQPSMMLRTFHRASLPNTNDQRGVDIQAGADASTPQNVCKSGLEVGQSRDVTQTDAVAQSETAKIQSGVVAAEPNTSAQYEPVGADARNEQVIPQPILETRPGNSSLLRETLLSQPASTFRTTNPALQLSGLVNRSGAHQPTQPGKPADAHQSSLLQTEHSTGIITANIVDAEANVSPKTKVAEPLSAEQDEPVHTPDRICNDSPSPLNTPHKPPIGNMQGVHGPDDEEYLKMYQDVIDQAQRVLARNSKFVRWAGIDPFLYNAAVASERAERCGAGGQAHELHRLAWEVHDKFSTPKSTRWVNRHRMPPYDKNKVKHNSTAGNDDSG